MNRIDNSILDLFCRITFWTIHKLFKTKISKLHKISNARISTNKTVKIDACGLQCPGPIIQLKKNYDQIEVGDRLEIKVTDQAFGEDLNGWCRMMGAKLINIENTGGILTACVEKVAKQQADNLPKQSADNKTLVVFSDDLDRALASFVIANGALATGKKVSIFFTFWG